MEVYLRLIWAYLKIGLFGFGGGYAMLSLIEREVVESGWISSTTFTDIVAISQMTPGPIGINSATYIGYTVAGSVWGAVAATTAVVILPYMLALYMSHIIRRHHDSAIIQGAFTGLRIVVVGLIASAALVLINADNFGHDTTECVKSVVICVASFCVVMFTRIHPIFVIIAAGVIGYFIY